MVNDEDLCSYESLSGDESELLLLTCSLPKKPKANLRPRGGVSPTCCLDGRFLVVALTDDEVSLCPSLAITMMGTENWLGESKADMATEGEVMLTEGEIGVENLVI